MAKLTRRTFLAGTSAGAVTLGVLGAPLGIAAAEGLSHGPAVDAAAATGAAGPLMVYVRDISTGEVAIMMGTREVTHRDPALVARLLKGVV